MLKLKCNKLNIINKKVIQNINKYANIPMAAIAFQKRGSTNLTEKCILSVARGGVVQRSLQREKDSGDSGK